MTDGDFVRACEEAAQELRSLAPKRTGNLAYNAVQITFVSKKHAILYVDESIAPYMPYTNEPWISPWWRGKKNPNEGWFDQGAETIAEFIAQKLGGVLKSVKT